MNADEGETLEFSVTQDVKIGDRVVIAEGARATGTVASSATPAKAGAINEENRPDRTAPQATYMATVAVNSVLQVLKLRWMARS